MTIRPARSDDAPAIRALLEECKLTLKGVDYSDFSPWCLVAEREEHLVGFIQALAGKPYAVITDLAVTRSEQARGIGVELAKAMELMLRCLGVTAYVAFCPESDTIMADMLERFGLTPTGTGRGFVRRLL